MSTVWRRPFLGNLWDFLGTTTLLVLRAAPTWTRLIATDRRSAAQPDAERRHMLGFRGLRHVQIPHSIGLVGTSYAKLTGRVRALRLQPSIARHAEEGVIALGVRHNSPAMSAPDIEVL